MLLKQKWIARDFGTKTCIRTWSGPVGLQWRHTQMIKLPKILFADVMLARCCFVFDVPWSNWCSKQTVERMKTKLFSSVWFFYEPPEVCQKSRHLLMLIVPHPFKVLPSKIHPPREERYMWSSLCLHCLSCVQEYHRHYPHSCTIGSIYHHSSTIGSIPQCKCQLPQKVM